MTIKELRKKTGLTQVKLAWILDMRQPHISTIESGRRQETYAMLAVLDLIGWIYDKGLLNEYMEWLEEQLKQ